MSFIAVIVALALEQWRAPRWRTTLQVWFARYARALEQRLNAGSSRHGTVAAALALLPPVIVTGAVYWGLEHVHPLLALVWQVAVLYALMGFRQFSHLFTAIVEALRAGDAVTARKRLSSWRGSDAGGVTAEEIPRLAIEQGVLDSYRHVFATLFWFLVLPGPIGAVLYRCCVLLADEWRPAAEAPLESLRAPFARPVQRLLHVLDWVPVRLAAATFAVVGDFEDAVYCWRTQARTWPSTDEGILLASAAGALGVVIGGPVTGVIGTPEFRPELGIGEPADPEVLPSAIGLVWRALLVWLVLLLLLTLAYWAP